MRGGGRRVGCQAALFIFTPGVCCHHPYAPQHASRHLRLTLTLFGGACQPCEIVFLSVDTTQPWALPVPTYFYFYHAGTSNVGNDKCRPVSNDVCVSGEAPWQKTVLAQR